MNATAILLRGLTSSRSFKLPTAGQLAAAEARVPLPVAGIADGGAPYTAEETELMFKQELAREMDIPLEELNV